jgi:hypothetical protein
VYFTITKGDKNWWPYSGSIRVDLDMRSVEDGSRHRGKVEEVILNKVFNFSRRRQFPNGDYVSHRTGRGTVEKYRVISAQTWNRRIKLLLSRFTNTYMLLILISLL